MDIKVELPNLLKSIRKRSNISQKEIADKIGITAPQFNLYENGKREVTVLTFWKWCEALDKKPNVVMGTLWEKQHPRSHISISARLKRLNSKPFAELTPEERDFIIKHSK